MLRKRRKPYRKPQSNLNNGELKKKRLEIIGGILFLLGTLLNFGIRYVDMRKPVQVEQPQPPPVVNPPVEETINEQTNKRDLPRVGRKRKPPTKNRNQNRSSQERANNPGGLPRN